MAEYVAVSGIGKGVHTFWVFFGKKIEKTEYIGMMQKLSVVIGSEELFEVEGNVLVGKIAQQPAKVVSIDVHSGQPGVWIGVAEMILIPFLLCPLLHGIVPRKHLLLGGIVHKVERSAGELENFGGLFFVSSAITALPSAVWSAFMGFVDNDVVPRSRVNIIVLVKLTANSLRATKVLHRSEENIFQALTLVAAFKTGERRTVIFFEP